MNNYKIENLSTDINRAGINYMYICSIVFFALIYRLSVIGLEKGINLVLRTCTMYNVLRTQRAKF